MRFLHVVSRRALRLDPPRAAAPADGIDTLQQVDRLDVDGRVHRTWEEAAERRLEAGMRTLGSLLAAPCRLSLTVDAGREVEWLTDSEGLIHGALVREHQPLAVVADVAAERVSDDVARVTVTVSNLTAVTPAQVAERDLALQHALVSTHVVLGVRQGSWLSLADPPADVTAAAAACRNTGLWPVLVGDPGSHDTILASPIILEDHPQVAAESAGELFDSTEIDEILSLRILTLTDDEKAEMRGADERARAMLDRTESLTQADFMRMHGTLRSAPPRIGGER